MRVTDISINNYRAFYGEHHINLDKDGKKTEAAKVLCSQH